jgi:hypothetical protein
MNRDEVLNLLKEGQPGIDKWNGWMRKQRESDSQSPVPDFSGVNMEAMKIDGVDLSGVNLSGANLSYSSLGYAKLGRANLVQATISRATLVWATLVKAKLNGVDLTGTDLTGANLTGADLTGANLTGAKIGAVSLEGVQLCMAKLDHCDGRYTNFSGSTIQSSNWHPWLRSIILRCLSWQTVRAVGGLQLLTKASYMMLILVPILAGVWQSLKMWSGQPIHEVSEAVRNLEQTAERREATVPESIAHEIDRVRTVSQRLQTLIDSGHFDPKLPSAWALGFFAALLVVHGHFVYQLACPDLIKEQTPDKFAEGQLAGFSTEGQDKKDRLTRATNALKELAEQAAPRRHRNLVHRHGRLVWIPNDLDLFEIPTYRYEPSDPADPEGYPVVSAGPGLMRIAIEEGARAEYELKGYEKRLGALIAFGFYSAAGLLVVRLVYSQAHAVAKAAGWF